jgi:hypothetical protein
MKKYLVIYNSTKKYNNFVMGFGLTFYSVDK